MDLWIYGFMDLWIYGFMEVEVNDKVATQRSRVQSEESGAPVEEVLKKVL